MERRAAEQEYREAEWRAAGEERRKNSVKIMTEIRLETVLYSHIHGHHPHQQFIIPMPVVRSLLRAIRYDEVELRLRHMQSKQSVLRMYNVWPSVP